MPQDQFGGTYVDDVDEFGGVLISEESTPLEREDYVSPAPVPPAFGEGPEDIPPGMTAGIPPRLSDEEWDRLRKRIALQEEKSVPVDKTFAETISEPIAEAQEGLVRPEVAERAIALTTPALARFPGVTKSLGEAASGFTSPMNMLMLGAGGELAAIPKIGMAAVRGMAGGFAADMAQHFPELWRATQEAKTPEEKQKAWTDLAITGGMTGLAGLGTFMPGVRPQAPVPPRIIEAIAKGDRAGLTKATQAVADVVREQPTKEVTSAIQEQGPGPGLLRQERPEVELQGVREPQVETAIAREPARAQGGEEGQVLLTPVEKFTADVESGAVKTTPAAHEFGSTLTTREEIIQLKRAYEQARERGRAALKALRENPTDAQAAEAIALSQKPQYFNEAIDAATGADKVKLTDAARFQELREAGKPINEAPTPEPAPTAAKTEITPAQLPQTEIVDARVEPFFERESEVAGLGRSSLPPTVADVRAQRALEARQAEPVLESTPLDPQSGAPVAAKVPDTAGETVKMRKSAERAIESPQIPEPVQERIEAAPESRYTQQSMVRVEDAVKSLSDADLAAMPADSNLFVASKLEQADRLFRAGDNDGGYAIFVELEKQGTSFGQNINQFKRLAGTRPEYVATVIDKHLTKAGKDALTPEQRFTAIETTRRSKEADLELDKATDAWQAKPTAENARRAEAALDKANAEAVELQKFVARFQPRSTSGILKSVLQGNLLTPISEVANLFGNMSFLPFRAMDRGIATGLDMIDATLRNKPRELSVQPLAGTAEALKGAGRGFQKIPDILIDGTGNVIKGETRAGLHPIKAWINQFAKNPEMPTTGGKLTLQDRLNLAIEGTFGVPAEAMLRGLGAGDVPFKEAARARTTAEQLKLAKVPRDQWPFAQKFPELFLPRTALEQIGRDTAAAVFQRESKTLNVITNWLRGKGEIVDFLAATVAPYKLTPWNIIGEILSYNPLIAMTRGVMDAKKGNTRSAKLNAGKFAVGSMLTGAGMWLYNKGLLAPSLDERNEAQKGRVLAGEVLPPNHINLSGLKRAMGGGDATFKAGDETADIFRGGGLAGSIFYMTANIGRDFERGPEVSDSDLWMSIIRQSTLEQARFGMNQSFLSGVEGLLTAIKDGNADSYVRQWANTVTSIPLPNTLNTISRASREYKPDFKADQFKDQIKNQLRGKLGDTEGLPLKRDFWGEPMRETPEGRDEIFYHFFDISKNKQVTSDPVELELYRLWRKTADSAVIPSLPSRNLTLAQTSYALDPQQYEKYAELVGRNRREIVDALVINPNFHQLTDEQKIDVLERAYRDGLARGKALFYQEQQGKLVPKSTRAGFSAGPSTE